MDYVIYALAGISIFLSIGGFGYVGPKNKWVIIASIISIIFSIMAIYYISFWPLVIGFVLNWGLKRMGLEPSNSEVWSDLDDPKE